MYRCVDCSSNLTIVWVETLCGELTETSYVWSGPTKNHCLFFYVVNGLDTCQSFVLVMFKVTYQVSTEVGQEQREKW